MRANLRSILANSLKNAPIPIELVCQAVQITGETRREIMTCVPCERFVVSHALLRIGDNGPKWENPDRIKDHKVSETDASVAIT
jgi:hypothetical protein